MLSPFHTLRAGGEDMCASPLLTECLPVLTTCPTLERGVAESNRFQSNTSLSKAYVHQFRRFESLLRDAG